MSADQQAGPVAGPVVGPVLGVPPAPSAPRHLLAAATAEARPRRIAVASLSTSCWGAERSLLALAERLPAGVTIRVHAPAGELLEEAGRRGLSTAVLDDPAVLRLRRVGATVGPALYPPALAAATLALARSRLWDADAVVGFSQWLHLPLAAAGRLRRRRVVVDLHDGPFTGFGAVVQSTGVRLAASSVAVSDTAVRHARAQARLGRDVRIVPRPVALPPGPRPARVRAPRLAGEPLRAAIVGRVDPEKRVELALAAQQRLLGEGRRIEVEVLGSSSRGAIDAVLRQHFPDASFPGRLDHEQVLARLADADVLLSLAPGEAFGRTVFEAALVGVPAVVVAGGGPAGAVEDGVTGVVVPPDDEDALVAALRRLEDDPALPVRLGAAARTRLGPLVDPAAVTRAWVDAVLGGSR